MIESTETRAAARATRGSAIKLTAELFGRAMSVCTFKLLADGLGRDGFGEFSVLTVCAVVLAETGELGLQGLASQALVTRELALRSILRAKGLAATIGLIVCGLSVVLAPLVGLSAVIGVLVLYFLAAGWSELAGVALRARGRATAEAFLILCLRAFGLLAVWIVLGMATVSVANVALAHLVSTLPALAVGAWLLRREVEPVSEDSSSPRSVLRRSAPLAVNGGLALVSLRVELLALFWLCGEPEVGMFAVALRVVEFLVMVPSAVAGGAMPALAREAHSGSFAVRRRTAWIVALLAGASSLGLVMVAPGVPQVFGSADYSGTEVPVRVLALAVPPLFVNVLLAYALTAAGRPERLPRLTGLRVAMSFLLALFLAPRFGALGAAIGFLVSEVVIVFFGVAACRAVRFPVPVALPVVSGLGLALPMAGVVALCGNDLTTQLVAGAAAWLLTMGFVWFATKGRLGVIRAS